jgi:hypothetical protein
VYTKDDRKKLPITRTPTTFLIIMHVLITLKRHRTVLKKMFLFIEKKEMRRRKNKKI